MLHRCIKQEAIFGALLFGAVFAVHNQANAQDAASTTSDGLTASASVGWSFIELPETRFTLRQAEGPTDTTISKFTNHDGELDGYRIDAAIEGIAVPFGATPTLLGLKGFYAHHDDTQSITCDGIAGNGVDCGASFLFDPSPTADNKGDATGLLTRTEREVHHWGVAVEKKLVPSDMNGTPVQFKGGVAFKRIDQELTLRDTEIGVATPNEGATYDEELETDYWGGYLGLIGTFRLGPRLTLSLDGEGGIYYAETDFNGSLFYNFNAGGPGAQQFSQSLSLSDDDVAFIGALKVQLDKSVAFGTISVFGMGEYYSYAPEMAYADSDVNTVGTLTGGLVAQTAIRDEDAWSATVGGRVTIPIN